MGRAQIFVVAKTTIRMEIFYQQWTGSHLNFSSSFMYKFMYALFYVMVKSFIPKVKLLFYVTVYT